MVRRCSSIVCAGSGTAERQLTSVSSSRLGGSQVTLTCSRRSDLTCCRLSRPWVLARPSCTLPPHTTSATPLEDGLACRTFP